MRDTVGIKQFIQSFVSHSLKQIKTNCYGPEEKQVWHTHFMFFAKLGLNIVNFLKQNSF